MSSKTRARRPFIYGELMNTMRTAFAGIALLCAAVTAHAGDVIYRYRVVPNRPIQAIVSGLVNMTDLMNKPGDGCEQFIGLVKVEGIQHSITHKSA